MIKKHILALASLASLSGMLPVVHAEEFTDNRWYIAPFGSYVKPGGDRDANNPGYGAGMGIGKILNEHMNVELRGFYNGFDDDRAGRTGQWDLAGGTADLQYYFFRNKFSPYAVLAAGAMNSYVGGNSGVGVIGEAGLGFTYELHDNFLIRSDVRYRYNNNLNAQLISGTDEFHDMTVNVGFVVPLGPKPGAPVVEPPTPEPDCSTLDSDSDGVNDCLDKCPGTINGSQIDDQGCPIKLEIKGVNFRYDSAELTPEAMGILDGVAESLINFPQKNDIEVAGHTSSEGTSRHNLRLSQRRSQSVADYLSQKGVTNRLTARGYGEDQPIADNGTEEGRERNRRVELVWSGN
ncbi:OmpA/MotB domain protein [Crenothrix polyspora]|uniref:OmpA/MotB domain protein n=1 Tax=Crenothrix polyspora TaxID=360316 RepID=A0A1R4H008_9GAMM|nr:OmpA family protein [Crenothrix polyspora]SJM89561.1 OmpA/MotB domain protein [Crenothrix polyspora]